MSMQLISIQRVNERSLPMAVDDIVTQDSFPGANYEARSREIQVIPPRQQMPSILSDSFNTFLSLAWLLGFLCSLLGRE